jgi:plastocyanin
MWIASDPHPTHQGYSGTTRDQHCPDTSGTAFDECAAGTTYTFVFEKVGSWGYHNHANISSRGTVVVTQ